MSMKADYYKILGIKKTADINDIKRAYRNLAMQYHPDMNPGDVSAEERFKIVTQAYEVLKDSKKRAAYDKSLLKTVFHLKGRGSQYKKDFYMPQDEMLRDFFKGFYFRQESVKAKSRKGKDLRQNLKISFKDAALGTETAVNVPCIKECSNCGGTGIRAGAKAVICSVCRGRGIAKDKQGLFQTCLKCNGSGAVITSYCARCKGKGRIWSHDDVHIHVPAGVETGSRLKVNGMGMQGKNGGVPGDFFVVVHVEKDLFWEREGIHIVCAVPVPFFKAVIGSSIDVPTLDGIKKIKLPPKTQNGDEIRIPEAGIVSRDKEVRGDLVIRIIVERPKKMLRMDKRMLRELAKKNDLKGYPLTLEFKRKIEKSYV